MKRIDAAKLQANEEANEEEKERMSEEDLFVG